MTGKKKGPTKNVPTLQAATKNTVERGRGLDLFEKLLELPVKNYAGGKPFFLTDLPECWAVPNVPLYTRRPLPFTICDLCHSFSGRAVFSNCGHDFCGNCARPTQANTWIECPFCKRTFTVGFIQVLGGVIESQLFQCRCGFQGSLPAIKAHVEPTNGICLKEEISVSALQSTNERQQAQAWNHRTNYLKPKVTFRLRDVQPPTSNILFLQKVLHRKVKLTYAFLDIEADGLFLGRMYLELRSDVVPKTVERFLKICDNRGIMSYSGSDVDFIVPNMMFQTGKLPSSKFRNISIPFFPDENFTLKHDRAGTVAMANVGPNTNSSEFYISATKMPWRDGFNVVFAYVISGLNIVKRICEVGNGSGKPWRRVKILASGIVNEWMLPLVYNDYNPFDPDSDS